MRDVGWKGTGQVGERTEIHNLKSEVEKLQKDELNNGSWGDVRRGHRTEKSLIDETWARAENLIIGRMRSYACA
jgi:hypothetical protein